MLVVVIPPAPQLHLHESGSQRPDKSEIIADVKPCIPIACLLHECVVAEHPDGLVEHLGFSEDKMMVDLPAHMRQEAYRQQAS